LRKFLVDTTAPRKAATYAFLKVLPGCEGSHRFKVWRMDGERFKALLIAHDRPLLRRLSALLESVGVSPRCVADPAQGRRLLATAQVDLVIVDMGLPEEQAEAICRMVLDSPDDQAEPVLIGMAPRHDSSRISAALAAGVDDILHKPLAAGEVFARIRAAARLREQQWRRHIQQGNAETPGCLPTPAWKALAGEVARQPTGLGAMLLLGIDHYLPLASELSRCSLCLLRAAVLERLQASGGESVVWGELGDDAFAGLLTSSDDLAAMALAERLRGAVEERPFELDGHSRQLSVSMGVASLCGSHELAEQRCRGALQLAQRSGHNCVVSSTEWENERKRMQDQPSWLDSANAWDIMLPAPLALYPDDTVDQAATLLAQTRLAHLPVVDTAGRLVGLVSARALHAAERKPAAPRGSGSIRFVRAVMQSSPTHFEEDTPARQIADHFAGESSTVTVVTRLSRPLGLIYRHSLAGLAESLPVRSSLETRPFSLDSDYLLTPEPLAVEDC
jgi:CheY-like chemotaxis protein/CBS domain-containing protein